MSAAVNDRRMLDELFEAGMSRGSNGDERAVLGAMMLAAPGSDIPGAVRERLKPRKTQPGTGEHHFLSGAHQAIWTTIVELMGLGEPFDALSVAAHMEAPLLQRIGGVPYLHSCLEACPTVANATAYARDLAGATLLRDLARNAAATAQRVLESSLHDAGGTYDTVRASLDEIEVPLAAGGPVAWTVAGAEPGTDDDVMDELERLQQLADNPELGTAEFTTGWIDVDRLLSPVVPGAMMIIAGRPGMSKTSTAINIATHLAMEKRLPVLFFSLEMSRLEIGLKALCQRAKLRNEDVKHGTLGDEGWARAAGQIGRDAGAPLDIDDTPGINTGYIDRELAAFVRRHGRAPVAFVVDHIGLVEESAGRDTREKLEMITRRLKLLAKKYGTVCIALSQLNRGPENRPGGVPQMSDLRNSGSIEQDADIVALLHREDYYDKESTRVGELDFIVAKHRNGPTDTLVLAAQLHMSRIVSMAIT